MEQGTHHVSLSPNGAYRKSALLKIASPYIFISWSLDQILQKLVAKTLFQFAKICLSVAYKRKKWRSPFIRIQEMAQNETRHWHQIWGSSAKVS